MEENAALQILRRAAEAPSAPAVHEGGRAHSYADLVRFAVSVEHRLSAGTSRGVGPRIVAVVLPRGFKLVASLLGVWLSGQAAIVVDILGLPEERVEFILNDCNVQHVVTNTMLGDAKVAPMLVRSGLEPSVHYVDNSVECPWLAGDFVRSAQARSAALATDPADTLAYVVYTSGSTGRPKGVMVPHLGIMNLANYYRTEDV